MCVDWYKKSLSQPNKRAEVSSKTMLFSKENFEPKEIQSSTKSPIVVSNFPKQSNASIC